MATDAAAVVVLVKVPVRGGLESRHPEQGFAGGGFPDRLLSQSPYRSKEKRSGRYSDARWFAGCTKRKVINVKAHLNVKTRRINASEPSTFLLSCFQAKWKNGI